MKSDVYWLDQAAALAAAVDPHAVMPNPRVGCVIVKNGKVLATGVHSNHGGPHAEAVALSQCTSEQVKGSTVYITLEPCADFAGKITPACVGRLIAAKPARVVVGALDPKWQGANLQHLQENGILAEYVPHAPSAALNPYFEHFSMTGRPWVICKLAMSADGRAVNPHGKWITGAESRHDVHVLRSQVGAIITTIKTVVADDCWLDTRLPDDATPYSVTNAPWVYVLGKPSDISTNANIFTPQGRTLLFSEERTFPALFAEMETRGIDSVLTECGPTLCTALLASGQVNELRVYMAADIYGDGAPWFTDEIDLSGYVLKNATPMGNDVCLVYVRVTTR